MKELKVRVPIMKTETKQARTVVPSRINTGESTTGPQPFDGPDNTCTSESTTHENQPHTAPPMKIPNMAQKNPGK